MLNNNQTNCFSNAIMNNPYNKLPLWNYALCTKDKSTTIILSYDNSNKPTLICTGIRKTMCMFGNNDSAAIRSRKTSKTCQAKAESICMRTQIVEPWQEAINLVSKQLDQKAAVKTSFWNSMQIDQV